MGSLPALWSKTTPLTYSTPNEYEPAGKINSCASKLEGGDLSSKLVRRLGTRILRNSHPKQSEVIFSRPGYPLSNLINPSGHGWPSVTNSRQDRDPIPKQTQRTTVDRSLRRLCSFYSNAADKSYQTHHHSSSSRSFLPRSCFTSRSCTPSFTDTNTYRVFNTHTGPDTRTKV